MTLRQRFRQTRAIALAAVIITVVCVFVHAVTRISSGSTTSTAARPMPSKAGLMPTPLPVVPSCLLNPRDEEAPSSQSMIYRANAPVGVKLHQKEARGSFGWSLAPTGLNPDTFGRMNTADAERAAMLAVAYLAQYVCENTFQAMSILVGLDWTLDPATTTLTHIQMVQRIWQLANQWQHPSLVDALPFTDGRAITYQVIPGDLPVVQSVLHRNVGSRLFLIVGDSNTPNRFIDLQSGGAIVDTPARINPFVSRG